MNNIGEVVGENWYYRNGTIIGTSKFPDGCTCSWRAINDQGLFVGYCNPDPECLPRNMRAYITEVLPEGGFRRHDVSELLHRQPGITLRIAEDINNAGQLAAWGKLPDGYGREYLVTPYQFELGEPQPGVAGKLNAIQVTGLEANQRVILTFGTEPGAQPIGNGCLGGLVLIRDASTHKSLEEFADSNGNATFTVLVPKGVSGKVVRYQALAPDECGISHTVEWEFE